ncbi:toxin-antitoxin system YwqK family antitoxin [Fusobacterium polymorphum]|uniref:toxin-antitoxin system YwqK family antitoxin n=1 Tax=Fusobacterium nucleatum subsp. polymorphum TaxID=76857 RepID=UPI00300AC73F
MKKIFLILSLFFVFCVNIFAYPSDFFKSYPNGNIKIDIDWDNGKGYYNANFYDGKNNKVKAKKNWENFWDINSFQEFYDTLKNEYSNQKIKVLINITNEEHPIGMFLNAKFYNSKGILVREANNDRFSHNTKIYDGNGKLINETENNIQQNEFIFKEYSKNNKLLNETYISFDYNQIGVKAYNNNNILIMESSYTIKNLDFDNVKIIMSNLFKNANYQNVLDGYEKFYDDNGNLELEKTYKNGELVDTKEYKINTYEEKPISVTNNSDTNVDNDLELKNKNFFEKNRSFILYSLGFLLVMAIIIFFTVIGIKEKLDNKNVSYDYEDIEDKKILYCNDKLVNRKIRYIYLPDSEFTSISLEITYKHGVPIFIKLHHYDPYVSQENTNFEILIKKISKNFEGSFTILYDEHKIIANGKFKLPPWLYGNIHHYKKDKYEKILFSNFVEKRRGISCTIQMWGLVSKFYFSPFDNRNNIPHNKEEKIKYLNDKYLKFLENIVIKGNIQDYYSNNNLKKNINIENNEKDGLFETFYKNGDLKEKGHYEEGKLIWRENYKDKRLNGLFEYFYDTGELKEKRHYKDGEIEGIVEYFYKSGNVRRKEYYEKGKTKRLIEDFFEDGNLKKRGYYDYENPKKDIFIKMNGLVEYFFEDGELKEKSFYKDNKKDGLSEVFYENGNLKEKGNYKKDNKHGMFEYFDENGKLVKKENYKEGKLV